MKIRLKSIWLLLLAAALLFSIPTLAETDVEIEEILFDAEGNIIPEETPAPAGEAENPARADFIDDIIAAGKKVNFWRPRSMNGSWKCRSLSAA